MSESVKKLYTLLSACKPDDDLVKRQLLIADITNSNKYKDFVRNNGSSILYNNYYSVDKLEQCTTAELEQCDRIFLIIQEYINVVETLKRLGGKKALKGLFATDYYNYSSVYNTKSLLQHRVNQLIEKKEKSIGNKWLRFKEKNEKKKRQREVARATERAQKRAEVIARQNVSSQVSRATPSSTNTSTPSRQPDVSFFGLFFWGLIIGSIMCSLLKIDVSDMSGFGAIMIIVIGAIIYYFIKWFFANL